MLKDCKIQGVFFYHKENHYNFLFFFGAESNSKSYPSSSKS